MEAWRAYLELALGLTEASRKKAQKAAKKLVGKGGATAGQLQTMAEELLATSAANREALTKLVRFEVDRALGKVGLATAEEVADLTARVRELEDELRGASAKAEPAPAKATPAKTAPKAAAKTAPTVAPTSADAKAAPATAASPVKKTVAKKTVAPTPADVEAAPATAASPAKKAVAKKTVAKKASPQPTAPQKAVAKKTVAKKTVAGKAATKAVPSAPDEPAPPSAGGAQ